MSGIGTIAAHKQSKNAHSHTAENLAAWVEEAIRIRQNYQGDGR